MKYNKKEIKILSTKNESLSVGADSSYNKMVSEFLDYIGSGDILSKFNDEIKSDYEVSPFLKRRTKICNHLLNGEVDLAISEINDINVEIIDENVELFYMIIQHKAYEKANDIHKDTILDEDNRYTKILEVLEFVRSELSDIAKNNAKLMDEMETFLEFLIFNSSNISIKDKRLAICSTVNSAILRKYNIAENGLERIVEGIIREEESLSKKNKFLSFEDIILEHKH